MSKTRSRLEFAKVVKVNALKRRELYKVIEENNLSKADINQSAVAEELEVSNVTISKWVNSYFSNK